jgi:hypothetical protein
MKLPTKNDYIALTHMAGDNLTLTLNPCVIAQDGGLMIHDLITFGEGQLGQIKPNIPYVLRVEDTPNRCSETFIVMVNNDGTVENADYLDADY